MRILIDGMGGDNAPSEIVRGAIRAASEIESTIILIGKENMLKEHMSDEGINCDNIEIVNASEVISNDESPAMAVRKKKDSSIAKGMRIVDCGEADCLISAGSTGALLAGGLFTLGRIKGVKRPAIAAFFPRINGDGSMLLLDCGANVESKPEYILQNGIMGSIFVNNIKGIDNPTVGLLNVGAEAEKGNDLHKEAYRLLNGSNLNFVGNIEARDVIFGACDVLATDGFSGNVFLKASEGTAGALTKVLKDKLMEGTASKLGAILAAGKLRDVKKEFDYSEEGGAPILGLTKPVLKIHGNSKAYDVYKAILKAESYVASDVTGKIKKAVEEYVDAYTDSTVE